MKAVFAGLLLLAAAQPAVVAAAPTIPLTIRGSHMRHFRVETAATPESQERGLMYRKYMPADQGMIFPMEPPRPATFWMKNTYLPLDIIFIGPDHRIISIAARAKPLSEDLIPCPQPVAAVLELNGGVAAKQGIKPGDVVEW
ncbi:DUF192 domain-containing protein [Sphingomonas bacterium]|uniref:DUF192 domain-containing protein n=1 Tax=Sphingomonas bacterium TaxID=1895847 RepID=UPI0020C5CFB2|nr:DUF192 domain-containing protein [Sphingomonas bacterium]